MKSIIMTAMLGILCGFSTMSSLAIADSDEIQQLSRVRDFSSKGLGDYIAAHLRTATISSPTDIRRLQSALYEIQSETGVREELWISGLRYALEQPDLSEEQTSAIASALFLSLLDSLPDHPTEQRLDEVLTDIFHDNTHSQTIFADKIPTVIELSSGEISFNKEYNAIRAYLSTGTQGSTNLNQPISIETLRILLESIAERPDLDVSGRGAIVDLKKEIADDQRAQLPFGTIFFYRVYLGRLIALEKDGIRRRLSESEIKSNMLRDLQKSRSTQGMMLDRSTADSLSRWLDENPQSTRRVIDVVTQYLEDEKERARSPGEEIVVTGSTIHGSTIVDIPDCSTRPPDPRCPRYP